MTQRELQNLVKGVKGAEYKRFPSLREAEVFVFGEDEEFPSPASQSCSCCGFEMDSNRTLIKAADIKLHLQLHQEPICVYVDGSYFSQGESSVGCGIGVFFGQESSLNEAAPLSSVTKAGPRSCFRAEIAAAVRALQILSRHPSYPIIVRSDSLVLVSTMSSNKIETWLINRWKNAKGKTVRNWDLLEALLLLIRRRDAPVTFEYIKAHAQNASNNMADWLAKQGAQIDIGYSYLPPVQP